MKWKRWLWRTVAAVIVCILLRTVWFVGKRQWQLAEGNREFAAAVAETEARDPDWHWEKLEPARKQPPAGKNSAEVIRKVSDLSPKEWLARNGGTKWAPDEPALSANVRYSDRVIKAARETLTPARAAIDLALTLKDYPEGYTRLDLTPDVISTRIPHVDATRHASTLLNWELVLVLEEQDSPRAAVALSALLNASRSIGDDPFLICQLVRIATRVIACRALERALAHTALHDASLATLQTAWAIDAEEPLLLHGLRGERALMDVMFRNLIEGTATPDASTGVKESSGGWFGDYAWWLYRVRFLKDRAYYHRHLTRAVEIAKKPIHVQPASIGDLPPLPGDDLRLAQLFLPAVAKCADAHWRNTAEARCAVVGIACERFRLKQGRWPEALAELCPEFLAAVPLDPFDGQPLRFAKQDDGVVVHSVGKMPRNNLAPVNRPGLPEGIEIGFRLWNPDARRLPPPPDPPAPIDEDKP